MTQGMPEIRFPRRSRGSRRARSQPAAPQAPLDVIAQQIRDLDAAAQRAADNVAQAAQALRAQEGSSKTELTASVADALVDRTAEIRNDCERLASLVTRSAKLIAQREGRESTITEAPPSVPPPKQRGLTPAPAPAPAPVSIEPEPTLEPTHGTGDRVFGRRRRRRRAAPTRLSRHASPRFRIRWHLRGRPPDRHADGDRRLQSRRDRAPPADPVRRH